MSCRLSRDAIVNGDEVGLAKIELSVRLALAVSWHAPSELDRFRNIA